MVLLLENGADPNNEGKEYGTPLQAAAKMSRTDIVYKLLSPGTAVNTRAGCMAILCRPLHIIDF